MQSALAAALIVHEKGLAVAQQDVARLEVAVEKVVTRSAQEEFGQAAEIVFQGLLIERDTGKAKEIVFEIVQIPGDGLAIEAGDGIADLIIQIAAGFDLKAREHGDNRAIGFDGLGRNVFAGAVFRKEFEKSGVAKVFFEIGALAEVFGVNFRNGKAVAAKMFGKLEKGDVFFANTVENANGTEFFPGKPDDLATGTAKLTLQRLDALGRCVEMFFKKLFENVHECDFQPFCFGESAKLSPF